MREDDNLASAPLPMGLRGDGAARDPAKGFKALILERGHRPARTHDVVELLNLATTDGWAVSLSMDDAVFLNSLYRGRYPTEEGLLPHGEPAKEDARRALQAAGGFLNDLRSALKDSSGR